MTAIQVSPAGLAFLRAQEGLRLRVYRDVAGVATIGYGHVLRPGDPIAITEDQAEAMLEADVRGPVAAIAAHVTVLLTQGMIDALVSFAFNVGCGALENSTAIKMLNARDYAGAADALLAWDHAMVDGVLTVVPALAARRAAERAMFLRDELPTSPDLPSNRPPPAEVA